MGMKTLPPQAEMERAYRRSDAGYDGVFFLAVRTTGVFCRPSCPAVKPKPKNVEYFATTQESIFAGYRPCKRCRPMDTNGNPPAWVAQLLKQIEADPSIRITDDDLQTRRIHPAKVRRYFKEHYGMTFQTYQRTQRMGQALDRIRHGDDLTATGMTCGFDSVSGFRDAFERIFGRAPGKSRNADCIVAQMLESPVGPLITCATSRAVCFLEFADRRALESQLRGLSGHFKLPVIPGKNDLLKQLRDELADYFAGRLRQFQVALTYPGTPFQQKVWQQLLKIPYGQTISYAELAKRVGQPGAQRAVGTTNGQNRIAILIPCHRVVNQNGQLGGYGGGLWRKKFLLDHEQRLLSATT